MWNGQQFLMFGLGVMTLNRSFVPFVTIEKKLWLFMILTVSCTAAASVH
jgi:hypothetical protein